MLPPRRRLPLRLVAAWLALALLVSATGVWLAQAIGPRHVHATPALEDFRRVVIGHAAGAAHDHADAQSHRHGAAPGVTVLGADDSGVSLLDAALAAAALLATGATWQAPDPHWRVTTRRVAAVVFPASHDAEPDAPPPKPAA